MKKVILLLYENTYHTIPCKKSYRSSHQRCSLKKGVLRNFAKLTGETPVSEPLFLQASANFIKNETLAQVFSREFCKISKNTFFKEHLWMTDSEVTSF